MPSETATRKRTASRRVEPEQADQELGLDHPAQAQKVFGHEEAQRSFADGLAQRNLPPVWLLSGEKGIGKATFAYACARLLLAEGLGARERNLSDQGVRDLRHGRLFRLVRRTNNEGKVERQISVEDVRRLTERLHLRDALGLWRVVVVDAADDLNTYSLNAMLKSLEEPPPGCLFFVIAHRPVPATLRSRSRKQRFSRLSTEATDAFVDCLRSRNPNFHLADEARSAAMGHPLMLCRLGGAGGASFRSWIDLLTALVDSQVSVLESRVQDALQDTIASGRSDLVWFALESTLSDRMRSAVKQRASLVALNEMARLLKLWHVRRIEVQDYHLDEKCALMVALEEARSIAVANPVN